MKIEHLYTGETSRALNADRKIDQDTPREFYIQDGHCLAQFLLHSLPATTLSCALEEIYRFRELQNKKKNIKQGA